ncbi:MAG: hypothetical protein ABMB14_41320 [Myxococcota bacterium]
MLWIPLACAQPPPPVSMPSPVPSGPRPVPSPGPPPVITGPTEVEEVLATLVTRAGPSAVLREVSVACVTATGALPDTCDGGTWSGTVVYGDDQLRSVRIVSAAFEAEGQVVGWTWMNGRVTTQVLPVATPLGLGGRPRCGWGAVMTRASAGGFSLASPFHLRFDPNGDQPGYWTLTRGLEAQRLVVPDDCG